MSESGPEPSLGRAAAEAAEEYLPKAVKLKEMHHAIMLEDLRELAREDRESVRRYRNKTVFGQEAEAQESEPMGGIVIADNISIGATAESAELSGGLSKKAMAAIVAAVLGAGGLGAGAAYLGGGEPGRATTSEEVGHAFHDTDTVNVLEIDHE